MRGGRIKSEWMNFNLGRLSFNPGRLNFNPPKFSLI